MLGPAAEELGQELLHLLAEAVLVGAGPEVGFGRSEGGGEVERREGRRLGRFGEVGGGEDFDEGGRQGDIG